MRMKSRWGLMVLGVGAIFVSNSCISSNSAPANTSFMWVATQGDQMVRAYTISQTNGSINPIGTNGTPVATGVQPTAMTITPDGKTMFIVNAGGTVTAYTIRTDGTLAVSGTGVKAGQVPVALAVDPTGKFLFVANQGTSSDVTSGTISVFSVSGTTLTPVTGSPFPAESSSGVNGAGPSALAVSPIGNYLYVAAQFTNAVLGFSYGSDGALTPLPAPQPNPCGAWALGYCVPVGTNPSGLAFSRCAGITSATVTVACPVVDGNNLFVSNSGSSDLSIFSACIQVSASCSPPNGTLTEIPSGSPIAAGVGPATILVDRTSDYVYAVDRGSSQVSEYHYSPATGVLTPIATSSGGASVFSGGITANIANNSTTFNWIVVTNNGSSSLSPFQVAVTGKLIAFSSGQYAVQGQPSAILLH
jgi:6-phosphogluconolactonase